jgi:hypothetical protein
MLTQSASVYIDPMVALEHGCRKRPACSDARAAAEMVQPAHTLRDLPCAGAGAHHTEDSETRLFEIGTSRFGRA